MDPGSIELINGLNAMNRRQSISGFHQGFFIYRQAFEEFMRNNAVNLAGQEFSDVSSVHDSFVHDSDQDYSSEDEPSDDEDDDMVEFGEFSIMPESSECVGSGLSSETIKSCLTYATYCDEKEDHFICVICQNDYEDLEKIGCLECGHHYHDTCITKWLQIKNFCPVCKSPAMKQRRNI